MMLTKLEKKAIALIQGDIPLTERPYRELARRGGMDEIGGRDLPAVTAGPP